MTAVGPIASMAVRDKSPKKVEVHCNLPVTTKLKDNNHYK
jgi:hypothetical protein